jgi:mono/diheme cytochrome c family protein
MRAVLFVITGLFIGIIAIAAGGVVYLRQSGAGARGDAGRIERSLARVARRYAIRATSSPRQNPLRPSAADLADGMAHFADHCASCHANDGSGNTEMGRGLYPKAPDMRLAATQELQDGELFEIIDKGVRFTGMPAWGTGSADSDASTWKLVLFIRHLPELTAAELARMKAMNPRSPDEIRADLEEERFLNEGVTP